MFCYLASFLKSKQYYVVTAMIRQATPLTRREPSIIDVFARLAGEAATEISAILNRAYSILANDKLRRSYQDAVKAFRQAGRYDGRPISRYLLRSSGTQNTLVLCSAAQR